jgi:hypothetical protein
MLSLRHRFHAVAIVLLFLYWLPAGRSFAQPVSHQPVNLSFIFPLSTNRDANVSSNVRLSLLYGRQHSIRGLDLNLGASTLEDGFHGIQFTGLYSQIGGTLQGLSIAFGPTYVQGAVEGVQLALFPNVVRGDLSGFQYSALFNFLGGDLRGVQVSDLFNLSDAGGGFLQLAGVANALAGEFEGAQVSSGFNYSSARISGFQLGLANAAAEVEGLQVGAINFAGVHRGIQVGALNVVRDSRGVPVGLFNYSESNGKTDWITYGSNLALINTGVRTTVNRFYSMVAVGGYDAECDVSETAFLSWHYGYELPLADAWSLGLDLGFVHIMPKGNDDPAVNDRLHFAVQARALAEYRVNPRLAFFAGGGLSDIFSEYGSKAKGEIKPLIVAGISAF